MEKKSTSIAPTRWLVFEVAGPADGGPFVWLRRSASPVPAGWVEKKWDRLVELVAEKGYELVQWRPELSSNFQPRTTAEGLAGLRTKLVERLTKAGFTVVPDDPIEVYAIELSTAAPDGRPQLYVGVTADLARRLAEHREELEEGKPAGRAVKRFGFERYRGDLVDGFRHVPKAAALELEAQVSALLRHEGFVVHGDGVRRRPQDTKFVSGISWDQLIAAYDEANA